MEQQESKLDECDNCEYTTELKAYKKPPSFPQDENEEDKYNFFCNVCSSTFLSSATNYPKQVSDVKLYKSIGYIANMILDKLKNFPAQPTTLK